jgi:hypothetical protein
MSQTMRDLAASIFERELALSLPIVPKGQEHKEEIMEGESMGRYDVLHLSTNKREWLRFALWRTLSEARNIARATAPSCAVWIKPHSLDDSVIPAGRA